MRSKTSYDLCPKYLIAISIHLLHAEQDSHEANPIQPITDFNPLAPCGARLPALCYVVKYRGISIHLLHAEQDPTEPTTEELETEISIHLLHAEQDPKRRSNLIDSRIFQSTCSMRSKTYIADKNTKRQKISIHLLHAEQD